jgi:heptosyltransferase-1
MKFLIVRLGSLGDVVHGIPAAAALRRAHPNAQIDWLVDPKYIELLALASGVLRPIPLFASCAAPATTPRSICRA